MQLVGLLPVLAAQPQIQEVYQTAAQLDSRGEPSQLDITAAPGIRPSVVAGLVQAAGSPMVAVVAATGRDAEAFAAALGAYMDPEDVAVFPSWETLPHERLSPRSDTVARRIAVLRRLAHPDAADPTGYSRPIKVLILTIRSLLQPVVSGLGDLKPVAVQTGQTYPMDQLIEDLTAAAYTRVDMVERRGEFAVRGGIVDVFVPTESHPQRLEFWGDDVEEIRWFSAADQRSLEVSQSGVWAPPCREILLTDEVRARARELKEQLPGAAEMLDKLAEGIAVEGMESLAPALVDQLQPVVELLPAGTLMILGEPERLRRRAHDLVATTEEFLAAAWSSAAAGAETPLDLSQGSFITLEQVHDLALSSGIHWWTISGFTVDDELSQFMASDASHHIEIPTAPVPRYRGKVEEAIADVQSYIGHSWRVVLVTEGPGPARRFTEQLMDRQIPARLVAAVEPAGGEARSGEDPTWPSSGVVHVTTAPLSSGFILEDLKFIVLTEADLTGRSGTTTREQRVLPSKRRNVVDPLSLKAGDYVVHDQHGVGRFIELMQRTIGSGPDAATREYLVIEYAPSKRGQPGDRLFVPTESLDQVTKYTGGESPALHKMGGAEWAKTKSKARKAVREIAGELVRLYSARVASKGHAFSPDTPWQAELEEAFEFVETPDQLSTIDEVKADMEKEMPMDRLICGDVGYGKTEIAVRAAFKAVQDGKQVAILVPTTLLVQQHYETFAERYAGFPVTVKALSRFQTAKESAEVKEGVAQGTVDVVIGTHRLITGDVRFKDLGLVVIDEEQRFGVEHKEALKQLRTNVDVLAMSATPIPRTLEMAVTGIREMSTLATPPEERHPVLTYVGPYSDQQVAAAIRRELLRDGQVFYVHNRVQSIEKAAARIAELVPDARVKVAHGKMSEAALEQVINEFWQREFDVLVSTTIVETGLDITNANTLIVERAENFGLSQLHQLRGRVGRGRERAYAYFMYPAERPLTETAHERLQTIAAHNELGAGMQVAMKDLEIRGAGNLLGGEQSGHIEGVGFDLYVRMVAEAVSAFKGETVAEQAELKIELPVDAHIPHDYISHERLRLEAYTKLATVDDPAKVDEIAEELTDRYGALVPEVERLLQVAHIRIKARSAGLTDITMQGKMIRFAPVLLSDSAQVRLKRLYPGSITKPAIRTLLVPFPTTAKVGGRPLAGQALLDWVSHFLDSILLHEPAATAR